MALTEDLKIIKSPNAPQGRPGIAWVNPYGAKTRTYNILEQKLEEKFWPTVSLWESSGYTPVGLTRADALSLTEYSEDEHGNLLAYSSVFNSETGSYSSRIVTFPGDASAGWQSREAGLTYTTRGDMPRAALSVGGRDDSGNDEEVSLELIRRIEADPAYANAPYEAYLQYNNDENMVYKVLNSHDIPDWKDLVRTGELEDYVPREVTISPVSDFSMSGIISNDAGYLNLKTTYSKKYNDYLNSLYATTNHALGNYYIDAVTQTYPLPYQQGNGEFNLQAIGRFFSGTQDPSKIDQYTSPSIFFKLYEKATLPPFNHSKSVEFGLDIENDRLYFGKGGADIPPTDRKTILHEGNVGSYALTPSNAGSYALTPANYTNYTIPKTLETASVLARIFNENDGGAVQVTNKTTGNVMACAVNSDGGSGGSNDLVELYAKDSSGVGSRLFLTPGSDGNAYLSLGDASAERKRLLTEIDGEGYVLAKTYRPANYDWDRTGYVQNNEGITCLASGVDFTTPEGALKYNATSVYLADGSDLVAESQNIEDSVSIRSRAGIHAVAGWKEDNGDVVQPRVYLQSKCDLNAEGQDMVLGLDRKNKEAYVGFDMDNPTSGFPILHKGNYASYAVPKEVSYNHASLGTVTSLVENSSAGIHLDIDRGGKFESHIGMLTSGTTMQEMLRPGTSSVYQGGTNAYVSVFSGYTGSSGPGVSLHVDATSDALGRTSVDMWLDLANQRVSFKGTDGNVETMMHSGNYRDYAVPVYLENEQGFNYWGAEISEKEAKLAHRTMHDDGSRFESAIGFYEYGQLTCIGTGHTDQAGSIADYLFIRSHPNLRGLFYHKEETDGTIRDVRLDPQDFSAVWQDTGVRWINGKSIYWMTYTATPDSPISNAGQYAKGWVNTGCIVINSWVIDSTFGPCNAKVYGMDDGTYTHLYVYGTPINADVREYTFVVWFVDR